MWQTKVVVVKSGEVKWWMWWYEEDFMCITNLTKRNNYRNLFWISNVFYVLWNALFWNKMEQKKSSFKMGWNKSEIIMRDSFRGLYSVRRRQEALEGRANFVQDYRNSLMSWHHWTSCNISRIRLLDLSQTHENKTISLQFFEVCIGFLFVSKSFSKLATMVYKCQHGLCRTYLAEDCYPTVFHSWSGSTYDRLADWSCLFQKRELWHLNCGILWWWVQRFGTHCLQP